MSKIIVSVVKKLTSSYSRIMRAIGRKASRDAIAQAAARNDEVSYLKDGKVVTEKARDVYRKPKQLKLKPVFKSQKEYQEFADKFSSDVSATMKENEKRRAASLEKAKSQRIGSEERKK